MATILDGASVVEAPAAFNVTGSANAATAVVWDAQRALFFAAVRSHGYYSSADGITWRRLPTQPGAGLSTAACPATTSVNCPIFRGALTVQPATGDLYALTVDAANNDLGLWQDLCHFSSGACSTPAPTFPTRLDGGALEVGSGSAGIPQGDYNLTLAAAPASGAGTLLFAGTVDLYRCELAAGATSCSFRNTTNAVNGCAAPAQVAPAQHALAATSSLLFLGNDGGLWRSTDGVAQTGPACAATDASHFDNLNTAVSTGGSLAEVIGFAQHPTDPNTLLAGLGATGSAATSAAASLSAWPQLAAGEGGYPQLDTANTSNWLLAIGAGVNFSVCPLGSACTAANFVTPATIGEAQVANDTAPVHAPVLLDPDLTSGLITGTCRVWRGPAGSGAAWSAANAISPPFAGSAPCSASSPLIHSLAAGGPVATTAAAQNSGSEVLYAGLAGTLDGGGSVAGHVFVTTSAQTATSATAWKDIALSPVTNATAGFNPGHYDVTVAVDAHDATGATVYAAIAGFGQPLLYRSTDFGTHWTNVSANLPAVPANAVLVDPGDANTVYIALDAGVYVTTAIATCPSANCWSPLGTGLPNSPVTALAASANLPIGDGRRGLLRAATYGRGIWQTPLLTAVNIAQPALTLSAASFSFPDTQVATRSAAQTLTLTSSGNAPVTISSLVFAGDFTSTADSCSGQTLAVNATCTVSIAFAPTVTGPRSGQLTVYANVSGGQALVALSGNGTAPAAIVLTPLALTYAATIVNQTTAAQTITIANTGGNPATLQTPTVSGDFAISANTCTATLLPSTACAVSITFTPTASGTRNGTFSITDSAGTQTATLTGVGNAPATDTLAPLTLTFAQQQIGTSSAAQQVTLTNAGDVALTLVSVSVSAGDFTATNNCGVSLAAHSTCAVTVTFVPTATGTRTATLTVGDPFRSQTVALTGTGVAPPGVSLSPASVAFPATGAGLSAVAQTVTLTNNGGLPLTISRTALSGPFTIASTSCTTTLAANASCAYQVVFSPTSAGVFQGALTQSDNAPSATQSVSLTGTGIDFSLTTVGTTSQTISSGQSAVYTLSLQSLAALSGNVAFTCTGAPAHSTCTVTPGTGQLGGTQTITVTVATGLSYVELRSAPELPWMRGSVVALALMLPLMLCTKRRSVRALLPLVLLAACVGSSGCGDGRIIPPGSSPVSGTPTPAGTYNLTVTGSSAGVNHAVGLTLVVQ